MAVAVIIIVIAAVVAPVLLIRFRKRWVAAFNLAITNRVTSPFASRLAGFGILTHIGRKSGRSYRTPVNVFRTPDGFMIALTYGREAHWAQNVLAAGGCRLETRGRSYQLFAPIVVHDPSRANFQFPVRIILFIVGAADFLRLSTAHGHAAPQS
jgi:deazaflavin-dependent oxidoreductase (nitroreductase family)